MYWTNVLTLTTLFNLVVTTTAGYWSDWSEWSVCSRSCGGGVTYRLRQCLYRNEFSSTRKTCSGKTIKYKTCNNKPCERGAISLRSLQCSSHNDEALYGRKLTWIPHHDPLRPCSLYCKANGTDIVHLFSPKVLDGTRCRPTGLDMCINGACWTVGCDRVLNSTKVKDKCGVCEGDGICRRRSRRFDWLSTGFGRCSSSCGVGVKQTHFVCRNKRNKRVVSNKWCTKNKRPIPQREECYLQPCPPSIFNWRVGPWSDCSTSCSGGYSWRAVICIEMFANATEIEVEGTMCGHPKPSNRKSCNTQVCPTWYAGEWSSCSGSCGIGYQRREVQCRHTGEQFCDFSLAPLAYRNCSTSIPCRPNAGNQNDGYMAAIQGPDIKSDKSLITVNQNEVLSGVNLALKKTNNSNDQLKTPKFVVTEWSPCSATCESGSRWRHVRCKVYLPFLKSTVDLPDSDCSGEKPIATEICFTKPCYEDYEYRALGMTDCSRSCLGGVQETIVKCVHKQTGKVVSSKKCLEAPSIPSERKVCNDKNCPQRWRTGEFNKCSESCGGGLMTRPVDCIQEFATGPDSILRLPDFMCSDGKPQTERRCNVIECPPIWGIGNWSKCSVSCGSGSRTRNVYCSKTLATGQFINTTDYFCNGLPKPDNYLECKLPACPKPIIKKTEAHFFQLNKLRKVKLKIGMQGSLLPGTSLIIHCPTKGMDKRSITWYKDGMPLPIGRRVRLSKKRSIKIKKSKGDLDNGLYTCKAGSLQANSFIKFITVYDIFKATVFREKFLSHLSESRLRENASAIVYKDPIDRTHKLLRLVYSKWQSCSVSCGGGLQARNVSCEIITKDYYEEFPMKSCIKAGHTQPSVIRSCNIQPCVEWKTAEWGECSDRHCLRKHTSVQTRKIHCTNPMDGSHVNDSLCKELSKNPVVKQECVNENCTTRWNVSSWSECMGECEKKGSVVRMITCIWTNSGLPAGQFCNHLPQPNTRKPCQMPKCKPKCTDYSTYCSMAKLMNLCRYKSFKRKCCLTCVA
ncbi:protein madd-4-like isoform X1 [Mytilus galloprovincialis]|uniref:protein madd-4-like isoform X1 n=1 Tax=Mytilus galloprovincialis TaxID=29158 RepID=UPI003F7C9D72